MADLKLFQIEKNKKDVLKTVLTNTIKMLTERDLLKKENLENNIKKIVSMIRVVQIPPIINNILTIH